MGLARRTVGEQMPTRFWNLRRRGGICWELVALLEDAMLFFSMSRSVERGSEEEREERCFRKGMRMLRSGMGVFSGETERRVLSHCLDRDSERQNRGAMRFTDDAAERNGREKDERQIQKGPLGSLTIRRGFRTSARIVNAMRNR